MDESHSLSGKVFVLIVNNKKHGPCSHSAGEKEIPGGKPPGDNLILGAVHPLWI